MKLELASAGCSAWRPDCAVCKTRHSPRQALQAWREFINLPRGRMLARKGAAWLAEEHN